VLTALSTAEATLLASSKARRMSSDNGNSIGGTTTAFTCRAGCKERDVSKNRNAGPVKCNALISRDPAVFVQPCRLTISLIQIGANGDVHPLEQG
jgi:hypothetical protein